MRDTRRRKLLSLARCGGGLGVGRGVVSLHGLHAAGDEPLAMGNYNGQNVRQAGCGSLLMLAELNKTSKRKEKSNLRRRCFVDCIQFVVFWLGNSIKGQKTKRCSTHCQRRHMSAGLLLEPHEHGRQCLSLEGADKENGGVHVATSLRYQLPLQPCYWLPQRSACAPPNFRIGQYLTFVPRETSLLLDPRLIGQIYYCQHR